MFTRLPFHINNERTLRSMTGLKRLNFDKLLGIFTTYSTILKKAKHKPESERQRAVGGGAKSKLTTPTEELIFILFYLKAYATYDLLGSRFGISRSSAFRYVRDLLPVLQDSLKKLGVLPKRAFENPSEFQAYFNDNQVETIIIDATERAHRRPKKKEERDPLCSGKKKDFTIKNTVITTADKYIHFLGFTVQGSCHDYFLLKHEFPTLNKQEVGWFEPLSVWIDSGYQGMATDYASFQLFNPIKKQANQPRTQEHKDHNKEISQFRVLVENALAGIKKFNSLVHRFRNRVGYLEDTFINIATGLHNLNIKCAN